MESTKMDLRVGSAWALLALAAGVVWASGCTGTGSGGTSAPTPPADSGGCNPSVAGGCGGLPIGPLPSFGPTLTASPPPPPISGGTLIVMQDGHTAIAADPDRDAVYVADTAAGALTYTIALQPGDEPGRLVEDGAGRVHVALRSAGALVTIEPNTGAVVSRRAVCPAPRGVAWDAANDFIWVACATGELVALPAAGGSAARSFVVERDLRDVVVQSDGSLTVSLFRSATLLRIASDGTVSRRDSFGSASGSVDSFGFAPQVAWRTIAGPAGSTITAYQVESTAFINASAPGGYSGLGFGPGLALAIPGFSDAGASLPDGAVLTPPSELPLSLDGPIVQSAIMSMVGAGAAVQTLVPQAVLPVDIALSPDGTTMAIAAAGDAFSSLGSVYSVVQGVSSANAVIGTVIAVAYDASGDLIAQTREPARLSFVSVSNPVAKEPIVLSTITRADSGIDIFHTQAGGLMACASCHPEGGDDGHVWLLDGLPRRTPSLRGTVAGTAPYHWLGDETTMGGLVDDVYTHRMSGTKLDPPQKSALATWVQAIPAPAAPSWVDTNAAARGRSLFQDLAGCATCHSGAKFTNNKTVDVGTRDTSNLPDGGPPPTAFQVPPLVGVGWRTPLMHDGCAATIADRFGSCATPGHGTTTPLPPQDIADLTAYLESL